MNHTDFSISPPLNLKAGDVVEIRGLLCKGGKPAKFKVYVNGKLQRCDVKAPVKPTDSRRVKQ